jgi:hypothetical protein
MKERQSKMTNTSETNVIATTTTDVTANKPLLTDPYLPLHEFALELVRRDPGNSTPGELHCGLGEQTGLVSWLYDEKKTAEENRDLVEACVNLGAREAFLAAVISILREHYGVLCDRYEEMHEVRHQGDFEYRPSYERLHEKHEKEDVPYAATVDDLARALITADDLFPSADNLIYATLDCICRMIGVAPNPRRRDAAE